jgi:IS30 family transposase
MAKALSNIEKYAIQALLEQEKTVIEIATELNRKVDTIQPYIDGINESKARIEAIQLEIEKRDAESAAQADAAKAEVDRQNKLIPGAIIDKRINKEIGHTMTEEISMKEYPATKPPNFDDCIYRPRPLKK